MSVPLCFTTVLHLMAYTLPSNRGDSLSAYRIRNVWSVMIVISAMLDSCVAEVEPAVLKGIYTHTLAQSRRFTYLGDLPACCRLPPAQNLPLAATCSSAAPNSNYFTRACARQVLFSPYFLVSPPGTCEK